MQKLNNVTVNFYEYKHHFKCIKKNEMRVESIVMVTQSQFCINKNIAVISKFIIHVMTIFWLSTYKFYFKINGNRLAL